MAHYYNTFDVNQLLEAGSVLEFQQYDLTNDIHPIFRQENFLDKDNNYEALTPTLRLASRFLTCPASMRHLYTICHGKTRVKLYPKGSGLEGKYYESMDPIVGDLNKTQQAQVNQDLGELAMLVRFRRKVLSGTILVPRRKSTWRASANIHFSERTYQNLVDSHTPDTAGWSTEYLFACCTFAITLCHELAHAVTHCHLCRGQEDIVLGNGFVAEGGFDWENQVLGGTINGQQFREWPSREYIQYYLRKGYPIFLVGLLPSGPDPVWRVPSPWINQLFLDAFWDTVVPTKGVEGLKVPRLLGQRTRARRCACSRCVQDEASGRWTGQDLRLLRDRDATPLDPNCKASDSVTVYPDLYNLSKDPLAHVPEGFALMHDGSMLREKQVPLLGSSQYGLIGVRDTHNPDGRVLILTAGDPATRSEKVLPNPSRGADDSLDIIMLRKTMRPKPKKR